MQIQHVTPGIPLSTGNAGRLFVLSFYTQLFTPLGTGYSQPEGLTPGSLTPVSFIRVNTVCTSILVDDISQPLGEPGRELLVVRFEAGILNVAPG